jgi:hypothetical protein
MEENKKPKEEKPVGKIPVFIPSAGREFITKTENGETKKFVYGFVNGIYFDVVCDEQAEVTPEQHEALRGILDLVKQGK